MVIMAIVLMALMMIVIMIDDHEHDDGCDGYDERGDSEDIRQCNTCHESLDPTVTSGEDAVVELPCKCQYHAYCINKMARSKGVELWQACAFKCHLKSVVGAGVSDSESD